MYSLINFKKPLFEEHFEAWVNGPVSPELYRCHRGSYMIEDGHFGATSVKFCELDQSEHESIQVVLDRLGEMSGASLSELTHKEEPWCKHRKGLTSRERSTERITPEDISDYYSLPEVQMEHPLFMSHEKIL